MKKRLLLVLTLLLFTVSCVKSVGVESTLSAYPTITTNDEGKSLFNYQGVVEVSLKGVKNLKKLEVGDISIESGKPGIASIHKAGKSYFEPDDLKNLKSEMASGVKYERIIFNKDDLSVGSNSTVFKLHYVIQDVPTDLSKEDVKRKATFTLTGIDMKDRKSFEQKVEVMVAGK